MAGQEWSVESGSLEELREVNPRTRRFAPLALAWRLGPLQRDRPRCAELSGTCLPLPPGGETLLPPPLNVAAQLRTVPGYHDQAESALPPDLEAR